MSETVSFKPTGEQISFNDFKLFQGIKISLKEMTSIFEQIFNSFNKLIDTVEMAADLNVDVKSNKFKDLLELRNLRDKSNDDSFVQGIKFDEEVHYVITTTIGLIDVGSMFYRYLSAIKDPFHSGEMINCTIPEWIFTDLGNSLCKTIELISCKDGHYTDIKTGNILHMKTGIRTRWGFHQYCPKLNNFVIVGKLLFDTEKLEFDKPETRLQDCMHYVLNNLDICGIDNAFSDRHTSLADVVQLLPTGDMGIN